MALAAIERLPHAHPGHSRHLQRRSIADDSRAVSRIDTVPAILQTVPRINPYVSHRNTQGSRWQVAAHFSDDETRFVFHTPLQAAHGIDGKQDQASPAR
jgi:hypothetical protein